MTLKYGTPSVPNLGTEGVLHKETGNRGGLQIRFLNDEIHDTFRIF